MRLTRRDVVAALTAAGAVAVGGVAVSFRGESDDADEFAQLTDDDVETLVAAAEVLYPSEVENVAAFVTDYIRGRVADRPNRAEGVSNAVAYLDDYAEAWHDDAFAALDPSARDEALRAMGADGVDADPEGSDVERVRYYVVDELLFALYSTPTGGELVGIENPQGYPGGLTSYQRGPRT